MGGGVYGVLMGWWCCVLDVLWCCLFMVVMIFMIWGCFRDVIFGLRIRILCENGRRMGLCCVVLFCFVLCCVVLCCVVLS